MEDLILLLVIFGVVSSFTRNIRKTVNDRRSNQNQQRETSQRRIPNQPTRPPQQRSSQTPRTMSTPSNRPPEPSTEAQATMDSVQEGFGKLVKRLTGEDIMQERNMTMKEKRLEEERLYKEQVEREKNALAEEALRKSREESIRWTKENEDPYEISDLEEPTEDLTDGIRRVPTNNNIASFDISEAQQGIIWAEVLTRPKPLKGAGKLRK